MCFVAVCHNFGNRARERQQVVAELVSFVLIEDVVSIESIQPTSEDEDEAPSDERTAWDSRMSF
jgi:hypothetical protein